MKLGFSTLACIDAPYQDVIAYAKETGMSFIEPRLDEKHRVFGLEKDEIPALMASLKKAGLYISDVGSSIHIHGVNADQMREVEKVCQTAAAVGAKGFRVFLAENAPRFSQTPTFDYEGIVCALKQMCEIASAYGVEVWVETHNTFSTGAILRRLIDDVASPSLNIIWDVMHSVEFGESPKTTFSYIGDRVVQVHIKDGVKEADPDIWEYMYTALGKGNVPIRETVQTLIDGHYDGTLSLEWESAWHPHLRTIFPSVTALLQDYKDYMTHLFPALF